MQFLIIMGLCTALLFTSGCVLEPSIKVSDEAGREFMQYVRDKDAGQVALALKETGKLTRVRDGRQQTPLHLVARLYTEQELTGLKSGGAKISISVGGSGGGLMLDAPWAIPRMLLNEGAIVNATDDMGRIPLHYAAERNLPTLVAVLIERGTRFMLKDGAGKSPMALARAAGASEAIAVLRSYGATE